VPLVGLCRLHSFALKVLPLLLLRPGAAIKFGVRLFHFAQLQSDTFCGQPLPEPPYRIKGGLCLGGCLRQ
jgi:hypothetical protein